MKLALDEALSAIHRERIRYAGVTATDVQDRIFLVREIRRHCPNAMIFILTDDLLYLHSESNLDFQGALVASTYPLCRDKTLSLLTGKTPGRLNITRDFVMRVLIHGVVPIIALLRAQFPQAVRQIFSWLSVFKGKGS